MLLHRLYNFLSVVTVKLPSLSHRLILCGRPSLGGNLHDNSCAAFARKLHAIHCTFHSHAAGALSGLKCGVDAHGERGIPALMGSGVNWEGMGVGRPSPPKKVKKDAP